MPAQKLPAGTQVEKINSEPTDRHQDGARGKVMEAFANGYFVAWDNAPPGVAGFTVASKLKVIRFMKAPRKKRNNK